MFHAHRSLVALLIVAGSWSSANAGIINTFDTPGDVILSNTQAPGTWYIDRYPPAVFAAGQTGGSRTGVLRQQINASDADGLRPSGFNGPFYNTQGRKFDFAPGITQMGIELFIPSTWANLNQNVSGAEGRLASFWGTAVNTGNAISAYPIIEFNNQLNSGAGGFRIWNNGSWINVSGFVGYDQWYDLGIELSGANFNYYVNGTFVGSTAALGSAALSNVILQGYNAGNTYDIYWDNLRDLAVIPEPATFAILGIIGLSAWGYKVRRHFHGV
jgi:hypothetical protein